MSFNGGDPWGTLRLSPKSCYCGRKVEQGIHQTLFLPLFNNTNKKTPMGVWCDSFLTEQWRTDFASRFVKLDA